MDDVRSLFRAIEVFVDHLESVAWGPLLVAIAFHLLNLLLRTRAWWRILRAAYPTATGYRWRSCAGPTKLSNSVSTSSVATIVAADDPGRRMRTR